jgi:hypothetical protein
MFQQTKGLAFDRNHRYWTDGIPAPILSAISSRSWNSSGLYSAWGQIQPVSFGWGNDIVNDWSTFVTGDADTGSWVLSYNLKSMESLIDTLHSRGIRVLGVNYPQSPNYAKSAWAGRHEPTWEFYHQILFMIKGMESRHPNFRLYDPHLDGRHDYTTDEAYDYDHLSTAGATKLSRRIDSVLSVWR